MNVHEHQAKELLAAYGVPVPEGRVAYSAEEAEQAARDLPGDTRVVKAQIHAGGRGKGGGVKVVHSAEETREAAEAMLGSPLVTHQTGPQGKTVNRVYIEEGCDIARELYLGAVVDGERGTVSFMLSTEGGVEIETIAAERPEAIVTLPTHPGLGLQAFQIRRAAEQLGLEPRVGGRLARFATQLYRAFVDLDCRLAEINPLVVTSGGDVLALDAKMSFDDSALFRHQHLLGLRDETEENPSEQKAQEHGLSYVKLDGSIGCLVNGAGLAMATMDILKHYGGEPANFLDVGGSATAEKVTEAFRILTGDHVQAIFVNIFGGIMQCDVLAEGLVEAGRTMKLDVPLVVRLEGTNVERGKQILADSELSVINADSMADGAQRAVESARG